MNKKIFTGILAAALLACVCMLGGCSGKTTIDLKEYVSVTFSGYDGSGTATIEIDCDSMLPLIKGQDTFTAMTVVDSFWYEAVENNGSLSNGDEITVEITYNEKMLENAKVKVKNPELQFTVSGLTDKETLDFFSNIEVSFSGISPECEVVVEADESLEAILYEKDFFITDLELLNSDNEVVPSNFGGGYTQTFKSGDTITLQIPDKALERLASQYIIPEASRSYTVQSDSRYILTAADLTDEDRKSLDKIAEDYLNEEIESVISGSDSSAKIYLLSYVSGLNVGTLAATSSSDMRVDELESKGLNSAYVGVGKVSGSWGSTINNQKSVYYFYDAQTTYYVKNFFTIYEGTTDCTLVVRIDDPTITPDGITYTNLSFGSGTDFQSAYDSRIGSDFEKLP